MDVPTWFHLLLHAAALGIPLAFAIGAVTVRRTDPFRSATRALILALVLSVALAIAVGSSAGRDTSAIPDDPWLAALLRTIRLDGLTQVMLLLVCVIAVVTVRYSRTYLSGDPVRERYARSLLATLACVTALVVANDWLVIAAAWIGTSLALHRLLTTYPDRPQALVAAHKKFLVSRLADVLVLGGVVLVWREVGSTNLDAILGWARAHPESSPAVRAAALLWVGGVALKSAQLPFHGWLIQVMEAPTPVSALLHAGVVNIGGFLLIRTSPLLAGAPEARVALIVCGTITAVLAASIMTTRVSVKVALAWSTCAQMGMLLLQCGLGLWHVAVLHLVAHSAYKAHAFLSSGSAVDDWKVEAPLPGAETRSATRVLVGLLTVIASVGTILAAASAVSVVPDVASASTWLVGLVLASSLSSLVIDSPRVGGRILVGLAARSASVTALYVGWHAASAALFPATTAPATPPVWIGFVAASFAGLFLARSLLVLRPDGAFARRVQPKLFAGLHLDEWFTRSTFWLWPPETKPRSPAP